jgi:hypothetical protein
MSIKMTPREYINTTLKCKICEEPLRMYEWGDWGWCGKEGHPIYNMFVKEATAITQTGKIFKTQIRG